MPPCLRDALLLEGGGVVCLVGAGGKTSLMFRLAKELSEAGERVLTTTTTRIFAPTPEQSPACILSARADDVLQQTTPLLKKHRHCTAAADLNPETGKLTGFAPEVIDRLQAARVFDWILVEADGAAGRPLKAPAVHEPVIPADTGWLVGLVGLSAVGRPLADPWVFRRDIFSALTGLPPGAAVTAEAVAVVLSHEQGILKSAPDNCRCIAFLNQADTDGRTAAARQIVRSIQRSSVERIERLVIGQVQGDPPVVEVYDLPAA
jgi:probable selenium-dependent hydroxylase accessory protein YqeC